MSDDDEGALGGGRPLPAAVQSAVGRRGDWMEIISREETQVTDGGGYWRGVGRFSATIPWYEMGS